MAATVESASMKSFTVAVTLIAVESVFHVTISRAIGPSRTVVAGPPIVAVPVVSRTPIGRVPVRVIPRTHANEHASHEIARSPVARRRACVRVIRIVAVSADWLWSYVRGSNSNPNRDLRLRADSRS